MSTTGIERLDGIIVVSTEPSGHVILLYTVKVGFNVGRCSPQHQQQ